MRELKVCEMACCRRHPATRSRDGRPPAEELEAVPVRNGDVVTLEVAPAFFFFERRQEHFSLTKRFRDVQLPRTKRATLALARTAPWCCWPADTPALTSPKSEFH